MKSNSANVERQNQKGSTCLLIILGALMAITSLSTDVYLPAMPQMGIDLEGDIELTITGFLIGFSMAQVVWGPISDIYGRKTPLVFGMVLFIIGSIGCAMSDTIVQIMVWRIIQAFGACTGPMLSRAMVRDLFGRTKSAEMLSTLMILMAIAPIVGPLFGGQLLQFSSWHSIFWALAVIGGLMLLGTFVLKETLPQERRADTSLGEAFKKYKILLAHKSFMKYTLCVTFYYVGAYAFIAGSPLVYIEHFGVATQNYGWLFAVNIVGIMGLSFVNRILVKRFNLDKLLRFATLIAMIAGIVLLVLAKGEMGGIYGVAIPVFFYFSMNGIIAANSTAEALQDVPEMAGAASALLGSLQYGSGILSSLVLATLADSTPWTMSVIIAIFGFASALILNVNPTFPYLHRIGKS